MKKMSCIILIIAALFLISGCVSVKETDAESKHDPAKLIGTWRVDEVGIGDEYYIFTEDGLCYWGERLDKNDMKKYNYTAEPMYLEIDKGTYSESYTFRFESDDIFYLGMPQIEWKYIRVKDE